MRMPPIPPNELKEDQRDLYKSMVKGVGEKYKDFTTMRQDGALLGPWNAWLHDPALGCAFWTVTQALTANRRIADNVRQVVILAVGARFNASYELYAHAAVAVSRHQMSQRRIATLVSGGRPDDMTDEEALAFDVTQALLNGGSLPDALYRRGVNVFGQAGTNELIYLVGHYCFVSITLNGFAIEALEDSAPVTSESYGMGAGPA